MDEKYYIDILKHVRVIKEDDKITRLYDYHNDSDDVPRSTIYGLMLVPQELPKEIAQKLIDLDKARRISNLEAELMKIYIRLNKEGLSYDQHMKRFLEEGQKIELTEEMIKEFDDLEGEKIKRLDEILPVTKEKFLERLKNRDQSVDTD